MSRPLQGVVVVAALVFLLFVAAFWLAPSSCEGGFGIYVVCGVVALVVFLAIPFALRFGNSTLVRIGWGLGLVVFGGAMWIAGLAVANFQILCRLF
jgi:hypothetical protein